MIKCIGIVLLFGTLILSCSVNGVYYTAIMQDHDLISNKPDSVSSYTYHIPFHKIEIKSRGRLNYHKIKHGCTMDIDTTLNIQGEWRQNGDTLFLNFPTYFKDLWHAYLISPNHDTLTPIRSKEVTHYIKND